MLARVVSQPLPGGHHALAPPAAAAAAGPVASSRWSHAHVQHRGGQSAAVALLALVACVHVRRQQQAEEGMHGPWDPGLVAAAGQCRGLGYQGCTALATWSWVSATKACRQAGMAHTDTHSQWTKWCEWCVCGGGELGDTNGSQGYRGAEIQGLDAYVANADAVNHHARHGANARPVCMPCHTGDAASEPTHPPAPGTPLDMGVSGDTAPS